MLADGGDGLLADLEAVRQPGRSPVIVQRLGETLRQFLDGAADGPIAFDYSAQGATTHA